MRQHLRRIIAIATGLIVVSLTWGTSASAAAADAAGVLGAPNLTVKGAGITATSLAGPTGIAIDGTNNRIFVADKQNNRVLVYATDSSGVPLDGTADWVLGQPDFTTANQTTSATGLRLPAGLAFDSTNNRLFVADLGNNRIVMYNTGTITNGMAAAVVLGQPDANSSGASTAANTMNAPGQVAYNGSTSRLFVVDRGNNRVLGFDTGSLVTGANANLVLGQSAMNQNAQTTTAAGMWTPSGVAIDPAANRLYVSDLGNNRVLVFNSSSMTNGMNATTVLGQPDFVSRGGGVSATTLQGPGQPSMDTSNKVLYVADYYNNRVVGYNVTSPNNGDAATVVYGQPDFTSGGSATSSNGMDHPEGTAFDTSGGRLWVADTTNNRATYFGVSGGGGAVVVTGVISPSISVTLAGYTSGSCGAATVNVSNSNGTSQTLQPTMVANQIAGLSIAVTTNASRGYSVFTRTDGPMTNANSNQIAAVSGTNAAPAAFPAPGTEAFGYTTDGGLSTNATRFSSNKWAAFTTTNQEVGYVASGPVTNNTTHVCTQLGMGGATASGTYTAKLYFSVVPAF